MNVFKIEKMDREQLLQICKIMNIKASKKHTKAQLITKLLKPLGRKYMMKEFLKNAAVFAGSAYALNSLMSGPGGKMCFLKNGPLKQLNISNQVPVCEKPREELTARKFGENLMFYENTDDVIQSDDARDAYNNGLGLVGVKTCTKKDDGTYGCTTSNVHVPGFVQSPEQIAAKKAARKAQDDYFEKLATINNVALLLNTDTSSFV